jgi:hypothetical protein
MVPANHVHFYKEIFAIPGFLRGPLICFGFQEFEKGATLDREQYVYLGEYFATLGVRATSLDLFDPRSELRYDMNLEIPRIEIGPLLDTYRHRQPGARFRHSSVFRELHAHAGPWGPLPVTRSCEWLLRPRIPRFGPATKWLPCDLREVFYVGRHTPVADPSLSGDTLIWIVARKEREMDQFVCPQQQKWYTRYA